MHVLFASGARRAGGLRSAQKLVAASTIVMLHRCIVLAAVHASAVHQPSARCNCEAQLTSSVAPHLHARLLLGARQRVRQQHGVDDVHH